MSIDHEAIARRLHQARKLQSLPVETVSRETGIASERIKVIESGEARPSGDEVLILANYYRHDFRDFLDEKRPAPFKQTDLLYRRHGDSFRPEDRRAIQEFLFLCEIEAFLETEMSTQKVKFPLRTAGANFKLQGEAAAKQLRTLLGYAPNEIPRDIFRDFRKIGCHIFRRRLANSDLSGLYIEHPLAGHCLLVNYDEDMYRQRFSACHEAAHAIFDFSEEVVVSYRQNRLSEDKLREVRANRFASCYLMPPDQLPRVSEWTPKLAIHWAQELRVSTWALSIVLREAKLIDEASAKTIRSVRVSCTEKIDPEAPADLTVKQRERRLALMERGLSPYYINLCFEAYDQNLISAGRLSEALLADHAETREISILFGRPIRHDS